MEALVPFDRLEALESHPGVQFVRPPLEANVPIATPPSDGLASPQYSADVVGEEVAKTNADDWHADGFTGAGVKVGIVDLFDGTLWNNALAAGEVPTPAGTFCRISGTSCDIWTIAAGQQHGQAVAEVVHEMAPGAQLYLATVNTTADLQAAVNYFVGQGVDIISRSLTARYDGPGNGTGSIATVINNAVANGIVWFNSAGNTAGDGVSEIGSYWRGGWADTDTDGWLDFTPGDEFLGFGCVFLNGLRWSDFGAANPTDYDVCVYDYPGAPSAISCSYDDQTTGAPPLELNLSCNSGDVDYLAIHLYAAGNGTAGNVLEFMTNGGGLEYWQNPYSATGPASDTNSTGALSVGAVDPPLGTSIASYSSRGPTNDALYGGAARIKPDISAASGVASYTYGTFSGTSASTPAAAGAAALIIGAGVATTPAQVKTYLLNNAAVDRGAAGPDNDFGAGEIVLTQPPIDLRITKTASPSDGSTVNTGGTINYTLTVSNGGSATANNVPIRDTIGTGLSLSSVTPGSGVTCSDTTPPEINCTAASIASGASRTVTVAVTATATSGTVLDGAGVDPANVITETNEDADDPSLDCTAVGEGTDLAPATEPDNFDCTSHSVVAPDLTMTKAASPADGASVNTGGTISYTLTVANSGGATASNVPIRDTIGTGLSLSSVTPGSGVTCSDTTPPEINCTAASIASGASRTVTVAVTVTATSGTVLNGAGVDPANVITETNEDADDPSLDCSAVGEGTDAGDPTEPDNFDCTSHSVVAPDLTVTKTASPDDGTSVITGGTINYTLTVGNGGTATASNVPIRDTIGTGLSLSSVTADSGVTCSDTTPPEINCTAASIPTGQSRTVTVVVTVTAISGTVLNGARVDPASAITRSNEDADDPSLDCTAVGEGSDAGDRH